MRLGTYVAVAVLLAIALYFFVQTGPPPQPFH
jgi:hypothetical protein